MLRQNINCKFTSNPHKTAKFVDKTINIKKFVPQLITKF